jgi:hypothetical protein
MEKRCKNRGAVLHQPLASRRAEARRISELQSNFVRVSCVSRRKSPRVGRRRRAEKWPRPRTIGWMKRSRGLRSL